MLLERMDIGQICFVERMSDICYLESKRVTKPKLIFTYTFCLVIHVHITNLNKSKKYMHCKVVERLLACMLICWTTDVFHYWLAVYFRDRSLGPVSIRHTLHSHPKLDRDRLETFLNFTNIFSRYRSKHCFYRSKA